jgi:hypothetical protein
MIVGPGPVDYERRQTKRPSGEERSEGLPAYAAFRLNKSSNASADYNARRPAIRL